MHRSLFRTTNLADALNILDIFVKDFMVLTFNSFFDQTSFESRFSLSYHTNYTNEIRLEVCLVYRTIRF